MLKKTIVLLFLAGVYQNGYAIESTLLGEVEKLPIHYRIVKTCGNWKAENKDGYYRLIIGDVYDGAGSEIYVQWITNPTQEKHSELIKTLAFPELNNDHSQYSFQSADCKKEGKYTFIKAKALYEHDEGEQIHDISIKLIDVGKYQLSDTVKAK
jgi:hypothetical protein